MAAPARATLPLRRATAARVHTAWRLVLLPLLVLVLVLASLSATAQAPLRAWLDRDRVAVGETTTLNIETDEALVAAPDYAPLQRDFALAGNTSSRQVEIVNGTTRVRTLFAVALQPRREGALTIPPLRVGTRTTASIALTATAAAPTRAGGPAFIESQVDDTTPYVQQAVGYTLKLYYDQPILSGQLDQDTPDGATLQRLGNDVQYSQVLGGRRYTVVERRFMLIPERSGALSIPGASFQGRSGGGLFDDVFGDGNATLSARGEPRLINVRPAPDNAPQPWLPLRGLELRYASAPRSARAGDAFEVTIELTADGTSGAQLPDVTLPAIDGAQVFADPPQFDDRVDGGRPKVKLTRRFSVVPARAGTLRVPPLRLDWFDVRAGTARVASLPELSVAVTSAQGNGVPPVPLMGGSASAPPAATAAGSAAESAAPATHATHGAYWWPAATALFALLWLATLAWALQRRGGPAGAGATAARSIAAAPAPRSGARALKQVIDAGDLGDVAEALCAMAVPPVRDLDALLQRLARADQRAAVEQLQRARWGGGDAAATRAALRSAFADGPVWHAPPSRRDADALPPLYPSA